MRTAHRMTEGHGLNHAADEGQTIWCRWACRDVATAPEYHGDTDTYGPNEVCNGCGRIAIEADAGPAGGDLLRETLTPPSRGQEPPTVKRARFTVGGEIVAEDTFATEGERAAEQGELGIGAGEQPISTAGPLFAEADAEERPS